MRRRVILLVIGLAIALLAWLGYQRYRAWRFERELERHAP